ncbi:MULTISPECIES: hypothetical protein [unclassified Devosia]|jgi:hypothetical protein|uniref:hypothetical protein n=1 Tax=unclassified Devosia TaxID=196773 RepID=UPI001555F2E0|nr:MULTISPECIES: hypothetical protein [unclassified Devosia]
MFTQILIYTFFFAAGVLALLALLRAFSARDVPDVTRFHTLLTDLALALMLVGFGQVLRLLFAILQG